MKRLLLYILSILLFAGCVEDYTQFNSYDWTPSLNARFINMSQTDFDIDAINGHIGVHVEALSTPWQFFGQASWLSISPDRGTDDTSVSFVAQDNMSGENLRTSMFWLTSTVPDYDYQTMVSVTQEAATPILDVSESSLNFVALGGTQTIDINSNVVYDIVTSWDASWLTVVVSEDSTQLTITAVPNPNATSRKATVTLNGILTGTIHITQDAAGMESTEYGPIEVGVSGGNYSLKITSDAAWKAITNGSWFAISPTEGEKGTTEVVLSVSPNNSTSERNGKIDFKIGSKDIFSVRINQEKLYFNISTANLSIGAVAGSRTLTVSSNVEWTIISKPEWITTDVESGAGDASIVVTATEHTGTTKRSGVIKIGVEGVTDLEKTVSVSQLQHYFNLSTSSFPSLPSIGGIHRVNITTDDTWQATTDVEWLSLSSNNGVGNIDVAITAMDNPSINERNAKAMFTPKYAIPMDIVIRQSGRYLTINTTRVLFYWRGGESLPVEVATDGTYSVTTDCNWLKINENGNSFTLTADEYDAEVERTAIVKVALTGLVDGEIYNIDIPVLQRPNIPIDMITFPEDQNWDIAGNSHSTITITGYTTDELWNNFDDSYLGLNITTFGQDEDWNH